MKISEKGIKLYPNDGEILRRHALNLQIFENYKESEVYYKKAMKADPNDSLCYNELGYMLHTLGRYEESEKYMKKAIELNENDDNMIMMFAVTLNERERLE